ncbi:Glycoside hydrolase family 2 protein [Venustampulla echinocandica]|uniref:Beta-mannosidase B n=1 Tax=Venustampulla echinocandica TaxID=2656787 RepID=A0A370U3X7_9HELO|nr:Glycoside hydrolase family 2 protein [Venustampulla echinocandica]RDL42476.1 Glycoside hydrolase family 2 protein [Venustampulla echinocandica]
MALPLKRVPLIDFTWSEAGSHDEGRTKIPTNIHLDLLTANRIPDPFIGMNEKLVQWVHSKDWVYKCEYQIEPIRTGEKVDLVFDGLDTFATVALNGKEILKSDNMFVPHRIDVGKMLENTNELKILFESAFNRGEALREERGHLLCWNGHYSRVYMRKAQYHFGWDWGPSLVTCGPWRPITIERYFIRISDVDIEIQVAENLKSATIRVGVHVEGSIPAGHQVDLDLLDPKGVKLVTKRITDGVAIIPVSNPQLWFPHTHGSQPLYQVVIKIVAPSAEVLDTQSKTIGFRRVRLIQTPLSEGSTFYFEVNNIPMFMGGSNWIPGDNFLPRMTPERYTRLIDLAVQGNQNMLRVWGGGIYEDEAFYDACNRRGVLVWQDFCFACGQYPSDDDFVESVKKEAIAALKRLRTHPSLAILAGNNEDYQVANEGLHHDMKTPESEWRNTTFGARHIYERVLPDLVEEHAPGMIYWPGSPFGGVDNNSDRTIGDVHIWNVSSGMLLPYQRYPEIAGRFVSEFGMLSCPHIETVKEAFFGNSKDMHPQSEAFEFHCKATSYEKRMFTCMGENFRLSFDLDTYVYLTQLLQSESMGFAFRGWRRKFGDRECGGALTNDSWPVSSWSIIDYYERPKPAYYVIARALTPLAVGVIRRNKHNPRPNLQHESYVKSKTKAESAGVLAHATPHVYPPRESTFSVWVANSGVTERRLTVELRFISISTGKEVREAITHAVVATPMGTTEILQGETPEDEPTVLATRLFDEYGNCISREMDWPQPLKHIMFPDRGLKIQVDGEYITVSAERPVKGLVLLNVGAGWSDNCLDVAPGDTQHLVAKGLKEPVKYIYYGLND